MKDPKDQEEAAGNRVRKLVGLGFWVQGFRCFPWTAVNFFLKDGLKVAPSTLQLLQNSANLPMVAKPLYGILSDALYIRGEHRIPYIAIGALLQSLSWLSISLIPASSISIPSITLFLLLGNLGASVVEVANDALVAETGKPYPTTSTRLKKATSSGEGELQSFAWMLGSTGGAFGNLFGGMCIGWMSPQTMFLIFGLLLALQFFASVIVREHSLGLPKLNKNDNNKNKPSSGISNDIKRQFSQLSLVLQRPDISYSIAWFAMSFAIIPILMGTMFFYQTEHLELDSSVLGLSKVFGQASLLAWSATYNKWLKVVPVRKLVSGVQVATAVLMLSDVLFVMRVYREMGVPDSMYVVVFSGLLEVLLQFKVLPFSVLMAELCPVGCEGSLMALFMSAIALASIISGYLGVALASFVGISSHNFTRLPQAILIQAACTLLPLLLISWVPDRDTKAGYEKDD